MGHLIVNRYFCTSIWRPFFALFAVLMLVAVLGAFGVEVIGAPVMPAAEHLGWVLGAIVPPLVVEILPIAAIISVGWLATSWSRKGVVLGLASSSVRAWDLVPALALFGCLVGAVTGAVGSSGADWSESTMRNVVSNSANLQAGGALSMGGLEVVSVASSTDGAEGAMFAFGGAVVTAEAPHVDVTRQQVTVGAGQAHVLNSSGEASVFATFESARAPLFHASQERAPQYARAIILKRYSWPVAVVMLIVITGVWSLSGVRWAGAYSWLSYWGLVRISDHNSVTLGPEFSAWGPSVLLFCALIVSWRMRGRV